MKQLAAGVYYNEKERRLEFDVPELLRFANWEDTPENRDKITAIAADSVSKAYGFTRKIVITSDPDSTKRALDERGITVDDIIKSH